MTLTVLRNGGHLLCSISSTWNLSDVSSRLDGRLWDLGRKPTEVKARPPHTNGTYYTSTWLITGDTDLGLLAKVDFCQMFPLHSIFTPLPYYSLGQHDLMYSPRLKVWSLAVSPEGKVPTLVILLGILSVIPYLFIQAFISMNSWLFTLSISTL